MNKRASTRKERQHLSLKLNLLQQVQTAASGRRSPTLLHHQVAYQCLFCVADPRHGKHLPRAPGSKNMSVSGRLAYLGKTDCQEPLCITIVSCFFLSVPLLILVTAHLVLCNAHPVELAKGAKM